jgi:DNA-binding XRE family transcriptional regulator
MTGDELRALRKSAGMTARTLARTVGYSPQRWSEFERGHVTIPPAVEYATRWVCENQISNINPSLSAAERAVQALVVAMGARRPA